MTSILALDFGGTKLAAATVNVGSRQWLRYERRLSPAIANGQPWRGTGGMAGEIGHIVVDPAGPVCLCGKRGCVERLASGPYMVQNAREALTAQPKLWEGKILRSLVEDNLELLTGQLISQAAAAGDDLAVEVLRKSAWALGTGIGNIANLVNPQLFILGGSVTKAGTQWWEVLRQVARETALPEVDFEIVSAALADDAPLWGAVALAELKLAN